MIYLKNITEAQVAFIPRNGARASGDMTLVMRNTTDQSMFTMSVTDLDTSSIYFNVAVSLPEDIATGEYQYNLMDGEILVSCGLMFIGDRPGASQYEETITYTQYESR